MLSRLFFFFLVPIFFISCKKEEDRSCFKTTGSIIDKIIPLGSFTKIDLGPYIQYELIQDTINFIEISAGENIINFIKIRVIFIVDKVNKEINKEVPIFLTQRI